MRISQLSHRAGLPVGTVKFYLRTGLLHHGRATSATQAVYDESHLERLRLVRALLEVGKLSHVEIQRVLGAVDVPVDDALRAIDTVSEAVALRTPGDDELDLEPARALADELGWHIREDSPHLPHLARSLAAITSISIAPPRERLKVYAEAASHVARSDVQAVLDADEPDRAFAAATGAVLFDSLLSALRRLASENQANRVKGRVPAPRVSIPSA